MAVWFNASRLGWLPMRKNLTYRLVTTGGHRWRQPRGGVQACPRQGWPPPSRRHGNFTFCRGALMRTITYVIPTRVSRLDDLLDFALKKGRFFNKNLKLFNFPQ
ncbi:hypothetical protein HOLleu_18633 [Holothuria leucospilota]|uniref:Uncharacterized protein n=1 Tax=Holothuria leucospilota TaxID=206669 RepID=A0A9Q1H9L0_HOLLE|nr:hypothetical protein HOLleu_18633 [Holothuria leucospilota]